MMSSDARATDRPSSENQTGRSHTANADGKLSLVWGQDGGRPGFYNVVSDEPDAAELIAADKSITEQLQDPAVVEQLRLAAQQMTPASALSLNDVTVKEGNTVLAPATSATFTVSLQAAAAEPVEVAYDTAPDSATATADFQSESGTIAFAAGETSKTVTINVVGDLVDEADESFKIVLSDPDGATIDDAEGVGTITDDDRSGTFTCRAAGLSWAGGVAAVSNASESSCRDASASRPNLSVPSPSSSAKVASSSTSLTPDDIINAQPAIGDRAEADARASTVVVQAASALIKATLVTAHAQARCDGPLATTPTLSGSTQITGLTVNGRPTALTNGRADIKLGSLGVLYINSTVKTATTVTQRGLWFDSTSTADKDVVVAEAKAGFTGNPCL